MKYELRNGSNIITCNDENKAPLRIISDKHQNILNSIHSPVDLLEAAVGSCTCVKLIDICNELNVDYSVFEVNTVYLPDDEIQVIFNYPFDFSLDDIHIIEKKFEETSCWVANRIKEKVIYIFNKDESKKVTDKKPKRGCCGQ